MTVPQKKPTVYGRTPTPRAQLRPREARPKQQALLLPMNAAALLGVKAELGKLRHNEALTTDQFQLLNTRTKHGVVTDEGLGLCARHRHCAAMVRATSRSTLRTSAT